MADETRVALIDLGVAFVGAALEFARGRYDDKVQMVAGFYRRWRTAGPLEYQAEQQSTWKIPNESSFLEAVVALPTFIAFAEALEGADETKGQLGEMVGSTVGAIRLDRDRQLLGVIRSVVAITESFEFHDGPAREVVRKFVDDLMATHIDHRMLIPIRGFSTSEPLELHGGDLRQMHDDEIHVLLGIPGLLPDRHFFFDLLYGENEQRAITPTNSFCVATTISLPKQVGEGSVRSDTNPLPKKGRLIYRAACLAMTAVRLEWGGGIALGPLVTLSGSWRSTPFESFSWGPPDLGIPRLGEPEPMGPPVTLTDEDAARFRELIEALEGDAYERWTIPLDRFRQVPTRSNPIDRLIDLFIATEGLFFKGSETEISFKLSLRAALASPSDELVPKEVFRFMRDAYSVRSKVVHGNRPIAEKKSDWPRRLDGTRTDQVVDVVSDLEKLVQASLLDAVLESAAGRPPQYDQRVGELLNRWKAGTYEEPIKEV